jgi:AhpC/TSA family
MSFMSSSFSEMIKGTGRITICYFWSSQCPFCSLNMDAIRQIRENYDADLLNLISIYRPMGDSDIDVNVITQYISDENIPGEVVFDMQLEITDALKVIALPSFFLFDKMGHIRRHAKGQFGVKMIEQALIRLLGDESESIEKEKPAVVVTESFPITF